MTLFASPDSKWDLNLEERIFSENSKLFPLITSFGEGQT